MIGSVIAMGGAAAQSADQPASFDSTIASHTIPDPGDLESDEFLVDDDFEAGQVSDNDLLYPDISSAVDQASAGFTIYVREGTYNETVTVDKQVDLIGAGSGSTTVYDGSASPGTVLTITGDDVMVHGFTFQGSDGVNTVEVLPLSSSNNVKNLEFTENHVIVGADATGLYHAPMDLSASSHTGSLIQSNTFTVQAPANPETGTTIAAEHHINIDSSGGDGQTLQAQEITIDDNIFTAPTHKGEYVGEVTSSVWVQSDQTAVTNNEFTSRATFAQVEVGSPTGAKIDVDISNNQITANWAEFGIFADYVGGEQITVSENTIQDAQDVGALILGFDDVQFLDNLVQNNHEEGAIIGVAQNVEASGNDVVDNVNIGLGLDEVDDATVRENVVSGTSGSPGVGINLDNTTNALVAYNDLENNVIGAHVTGSASADIEHRKNTFVENSNVGIFYSGFDTGVAPADRPVAHYNDFSQQGDDIANNVGARIDARLNWFGVNDPSIATEASISGNVIYDPFLTMSPFADSLEQQLSKTEAYAHDFTIQESTGPVHVISFPGPVDRSAGEVFADLPAGSEIFSYDAESGSWVQPSASDQIGALDTFVITDLPEGSSVTIVAGYANDGAAAPSSKSLGPGWNLIGAPEKNNVDDAFAGSSATLTQIIHSYQGPMSQPAFMNGVDASGTPPAWAYSVGSGESERCVSPFTGYWVFVDDDDPGQLPAQLFKGVPFLDEISLLNTDSVCESNS